MLYHLFRWLNEEHAFPYLVRYPSFRLAAAFLTALVFCLLFGPGFIRWLKRRNFGENVQKMGDARRAIVPEGKEGTPTMGGILTSSALLVSALLWCPLDAGLVWIGLFVFVAATAIGYWDDATKLFHPTRHGISAKAKLFWIGVVSLIAACWLRYGIWTDAAGLSELQVLVLPFLKNAFVSLTWAWGLPFLVFVVLVLVFSTNAVNLTDGMDGLAAGCLAIAGIAMTAMNYIVGDADLAGRFFVRHVPGGQEVAVMIAALTGAALGFLWFNAAPAEVFMGDVGSLGFGMLLGYSAVASRMEPALVIVGGVFVVEALSVLIQVSSYKLRKKRVFLCAPIHHHFQKLEIPETKIVIRFWCVAIVLAVFSVALFKIR